MRTQIFSDAMCEEIQAIVERVLDERYASRREKETSPDSEALTLRKKLQLILAKEFITVKDSAFLLSCSARHIHNLVEKAKQGKPINPIPYRTVDGVTIFRLSELLTWTECEARSVN